MIFGIIYPFLLLNSTFKLSEDKLKSISQSYKGIQFSKSMTHRDGSFQRKTHILVPKKYLITRNLVLRRNPLSMAKRNLNQPSYLNVLREDMMAMPDFINLADYENRFIGNFNKQNKTHKKLNLFFQ